MKKIIYMTILSTILSFFGCKTKEEKFLEKHQVLFCKTDAFESFIEKAEIKPDIAKNLMIDYTNKNNLPPSAYLYFIIDGYYAFTNYTHPKIPEAHTGNIWVNSKTGEIKHIEDGAFLRAYNSYEWKK
jgi:hypothetical protein